jgi:hypothetical protein
LSAFATVFERERCANRAHLRTRTSNLNLNLNLNPKPRTQELRHPGTQEPDPGIAIADEIGIWRTVVRVSI